VKILFVGSYLSRKRGSHSIAEKVYEGLKNRFQISLVSKQNNKLLRLLDIIVKTIFFRGDVAVIDVFSDKAFFLAYISSKILSKKNKKIILVLHGGKLADFHQVNERYVESVLVRGNLILSPSKFLIKHFSKVGFEIRHLPNPVDLKNFKQISIKKNRSILWVRAFDEIYNPQLAIMILHEVRKQHGDITLSMVGPDLGLLNDCKMLITELGLEDSVKIYGSVSNYNLPKIYNEHLIYLNTTSFESFGVALIESAACGLPIVTTQVGEIPYIWENNFNALISESITSIELSKLITILLNNDNVYKKIKDNALILSKKYEKSKILNMWESILLEVARS
jgi:glycosyltransferase involved in cell wall biosynthesis